MFINEIPKNIIETMTVLIVCFVIYKSTKITQFE